MNIDTPYNLRLTENINFAQENSTQITTHHATLLSAIHVKVSFLNTLNPRTAKEAGKDLTLDQSCPYVVITHI